MTRTRADCPQHGGTGCTGGVVECWSPGGPCPEPNAAGCETCGPCQHCDPIAYAVHMEPLKGPKVGRYGVELIDDVRCIGCGALSVNDYCPSCLRGGVQF